MEKSVYVAALGVVSLLLLIVSTALFVKQLGPGPLPAASKKPAITCIASPLPNGQAFISCEVE